MDFSQRLERVRGLIFDLDGTLYCQSPLRKKMRNEMLAALLRNPFKVAREIRVVQAFRSAQEHLRRLERPIEAHTQLAMAADQAGVTTAEAGEIIDRWMDSAPLKHLAPCMQPRLTEFLDNAAGRGYQMAVLSDYPARRKLEALGIADYFQNISCAQDPQVGAFKPMPNGIQSLLQELQLEPTEALYVGDRIEVDAEAAKRAGVIAVIVGARASESGENWFGAPDFASLGQRLFTTTAAADYNRSTR